MTNGLCPVVGMGASAGGLEALQRFFGRLPSDSGMAFVVVQHIDPRHETLLPELLRKSTAMSVELAKEETPLEPDHVYVIPPNAILTIEGGILRVETPADPHSLHSPIDRLFDSLAQDQGHNAVCMLLSGSGSDGTLGLRAVKEHGGMAMAQSPESAQHDGILRSAISTGLVDHVLPPEELAIKLMEYATYLRHLRVEQGTEPQVAAGEDELARISTILLHKTGHDFRRYKTATLVRRLQRRMQVLQVPSVADYIDRLHQDPKEADQLFRDLLIGVTHFFRDPDAFVVLAREVIPRLFELAAVDGSLRVWTPGCATGEETYSIAILLREEMLKRGVSPRVQIFAGDIDEEALEFARQARYPEGIAQHVLPERLGRFFIRQDHGYQVSKDIREMCIFSAHNLIKDPPFSRLDLIACRNVLIYLETDLQRYVAGLFHYALHRGGYLFLGPSESVVGPSELFRTIDRKHRIFERGDTIARPLEVAPVLRGLGGGGRGHERATPAVTRSRQQELVATLEHVLLNQYAPAWVVVNARAEALYFSPRIGRYLEPAPGAPSNDVISMARLGLRLDLRTAIHKAVRTGEQVVHPDILVETNGESQRINLLIRPVPELGADSGLFLVIFQELGPPKLRGQAGGDASPVPQAIDNNLIQQLESELRTTKEHLQATVEEVETSNEELKSSNEELLATNEELQSSNEELQTSKEELQSVDEELETINVELQKKVEELDTANSDLENLFQATQIPTLFLDNELRIKRFTAAATELFHLIDSDIGRPITDIAARFAENLIPEMTEVLRTLAPKARQVRLGDGSSTYIMRIRSYRRVDNVIDGLVLTFSDVTQLEQALEQRGKLASIVDTAHDAIVSRTLDGVITTWNESATRLFGWSEQETLGKSIFDLIVPPDHRGEIEPIEARLKRGERVPPYESVRVTKDGRRVPVLVAVSPVKDASGRLIGSSGIFVDLTALKRAHSIEQGALRKDQFLSTLSHELRGPLATLRLCVDLLQRQGPDATRSRDALSMADRQLEHLAALVDQLLDTSRIASGRIALNRVDRNLVDVVRTSAEDQRPILEAAGVRLDLSMPNAPLWVSCDPLRVSQIVVNLLGNAAKFTDRRGLVTVSLRKDDEGKMAVLTVQDDGIGIEPEMLGKLFQPYSQGDPIRERSQTHGGLGLGLALVHALVVAHGGTVEARSEGRGRGAEFIVRLPILDRNPEEPVPSPRLAGTRSEAGRKILVVEDNWDTAESLRSVLELAGHEIQVAPDGKSALTRSTSFHPDLLVCDIGLPGGMDGHAVAVAIRSDPVSYGKPYLIALSGYGQPADKARALAAGFDRHVTKAEHPRVLLGLINELPRVS